MLAIEAEMGAESGEGGPQFDQPGPENSGVSVQT